MKKPILVGGLGLALFLGILGKVQGSLVDVSGWLLWGAIAWGGLSFWRHTQPQLSADNPDTPLSKQDVEQAIARAKDWATALEAESSEATVGRFRQTLDTLDSEFEREQLNLVVAGGRGSGKSTLLQQLSKITFPCALSEAPPLFTELNHYDQAAQNQVFAADIVVVLVTGDLMASQWRTFQHWHRARQRLILVFNKSDQYLPAQQELIFNQLRQHCTPAIASEDIMTIAAAPRAIKVKKIDAQGNATEHFEQPKPQLGSLTTHLRRILDNPETRQQLLWSTIWRKAQLAQHNIKQELNQFRRRRAMPIVEKYQWLAAGATFANPVAALDLLATAAVTGQMIMDLGAVYQQRLSLSQAQAIAQALCKQMLQLGLVELSTQAVGGILKTNAVTFIAGGAIQGVSAAYLTHIAGLSLIEYFQEQPLHSVTSAKNTDRLGGILQSVFERNQKSNFLASFVQGATDQLMPKATS